MAEVVTAATATAPYSFADNTISDLGASTCTTIAYRFGDVPVCSPWHPVLNTALVVSGVLVAAPHGNHRLFPLAGRLVRT